MEEETKQKERKNKLKQKPHEADYCIESCQAPTWALPGPG
jgi:hypothetical protein